LGAATTSCSAGLLGQLRATPEQGEIVQRTFRAIWALQHELEEPVGLRDVGSLRVAETPEREREMADLLRIAQSIGIEARLIDKDEAQRLIPALDARHARAIGWIPGDGYIDAYQLAMAYARSARGRGVKFWTGTAVKGFRVRDGRFVGVTTDRGDVECS